MTATLTANYMNTTVAAGTFNVSSGGWIQGTFVSDPAVRYQLAGGVLASTETLPMWGGVGINETVTPNGAAGAAPDQTLGGLITRATTLTAGVAGQLTGFSVFDQNYAAVITTGSPVPLSGSYMLVNFFRLGSNARIIVACSPSLVSLEQSSILSQVSWDFVGQQLIPYIPAYASATATGATYNSTSGVLQLTFASAPFGASYATLGAYVSVSGITGTGAGVSSLAGNFPITAIGTSGTVISLQAPTSLTASGLSGGTIAAGGGALPVKVLQIETSNSMIVVYNATTGLASWNYAGTVAIILI